MIVTSMLKHSRGIGLNGDLCVRDSEDMKLFKSLTLHRNIVMGRKTAESLPHALPDRANFVLTKDKSWSREGFIPLSLHLPSDPVFIGGAEIFRLALPLVNTIHLSVFDRPDLEADVYLPAFEEDFELVDCLQFTNFTYNIFRRVKTRACHRSMPSKTY